MSPQVHSAVNGLRLLRDHCMAVEFHQRCEERISWYDVPGEPRILPPKRTATIYVDAGAARNLPDSVSDGLYTLTWDYEYYAWAITVEDTEELWSAIKEVRSELWKL